MITGRSGLRHIVSMCLFFATALGARSAHAALADDVGAFLKDLNHLTAQSAIIDSDRLNMALDVNNKTALTADVLKFFADRDIASADEIKKITDRHLVRADIGLGPIAFTKPPRGTGSLAGDAAAFVHDHDARVSAEAQIDADLVNLQSSFLKNDVSGMTSNANAFFHDRHNWLQLKEQVNADVAALKKDIKFKSTLKAIPSKGGDLSADTTKFLTDRANWLALETALEADINNLRGLLGNSSSLEAAVNTMITDRHGHYIGELQLAFDRISLRLDVGLKVPKALKAPAVKTTGKTKQSKEDDTNEPNSSLDNSDSSEGEK